MPQRTVALRLANGQLMERLVGEAKAQLDGVHGTIICVFGEDDSPTVIGAHVLEAFLLAVDPVGERLVAMEGYR